MDSITLPRPIPSIQEGCFLTPSILGPGACASIVRYPSSMITAPSISGSIKIPATLTCSHGTWDGSPLPNFSYQWFADGLIIPGENNLTYLTIIDDDTKVITCEVTAFSYLGSVVGLSNGISVERVEPVILNEFNIVSIIGNGFNGGLAVNSLLSTTIIGNGFDKGLVVNSLLSTTIIGGGAKSMMSLLGLDVCVISVEFMAPTGLTLQDNSTSIGLTWVDNNSGAAQEDGFRVYHSTTQIDLAALPAPLVDLPPDTTEYVDVGALVGINHYLVSTYIGGHQVFCLPKSIVLVGSSVSVGPVNITEQTLFVNHGAVPAATAITEQTLFVSHGPAPSVTAITEQTLFINHTS